MGLFGFIKKAVGKVAGAGLSVLTHGASDKVIKAFKGSAGSRSPRQTEALLAKVEAPIPHVERTTQYDRGVSGWGFARDGYGADRENGKKRMPGKRKARSRVRYEPEPEPEPRRAAPRKRARKPRAARSAGKRRPPTGGLDLKALSASWRAAGKPGTWQGWIKANK